MKLDVKGLTKSFGEQPVLKNVDLFLDKVASLVLIGPSGGGKTTLLRLLAGLERPDSGSVCINGYAIDYREKPLREYRKRVGMVFQNYNLFPHLTALENITLPLEKVHGFSAADAKEQALSMLARFDLAEHAHKKPAALSGGQKQRIAISRAVAVKPEFLLLDEPTSALDPEFTAEILDLIEELREEGMQLILVTHEMGFARVAADRLLFISDGGVSAQGSPDDFFGEWGRQDPKIGPFLAKILKYA